MKEKIKVLMLNGSPKPNGNTSIALREMEKVFKENGVEVETVTVGNKAIRGCVACNTCYEKGKCVFDDAVNELAPKFEEADGLVVASPVYYASANATFDELNKYFTISGMPIASSQYWNSIHGRTPGEAEADEEGKQTMRALAANMTFLMKSIALGKEKFGLPEKEDRVATNFVR